MIFNDGKDLKVVEKSKQKDQAKLISLIKELEDRRSCSVMSDTLHAQLKQWITDIQVWEDSISTGNNQRSCKSVRFGAPNVDNHSMREKGLSYKGDENFDRKPHGEGKVLFENGDWMRGEFKDGLRHGQGTMKTTAELAV